MVCASESPPVLSEKPQTFHLSGTLSIFHLNNMKYLRKLHLVIGGGKN